MKKAICMILALLMTAAAQLHLCARVSVGGEALPYLFSLSAVARGAAAARAAADEIRTDGDGPPGMTVRFGLSARPPTGDAAPLSDRLLRAAGGVVLRDGVCVNGLYIGCVADGEKLREALRVQLYGNRPPGAVSGRYTEQIELRPLYTRPDREISTEDACMLVTGLSPVIYMDEEGKVVRA